jgi:hypothetical protein
MKFSAAFDNYLPTCMPENPKTFASLNFLHYSRASPSWKSGPAMLRLIQNECCLTAFDIVNWRVSLSGKCKNLVSRGTRADFAG